MTPQEFTFQDHPIRTLKIAGEPWLVAVDVLRALGIAVDATKGAHNKLLILDADEKRVEKIPLQTLTGNVGNPSPRTTLISESGFYKLTMRAQRKNPKAREFQDWVTKTVLPSIRKDGGYVMGEEKLASGEISEEEFVLKAMEMQRRKIERLTAKVAVLSDEYEFVSIAEFVSSNHVYLGNTDRARLAARARRIAKADGVELKKSPRVFQSMNGPIDTAVNIYPRGVLDRATAELDLFATRKLGDAV